MEQKFFEMRMKGLSDSEGTFEGMLSPYGGPPDEGGDVVEPGAYVKTLKDQGPTRPMLWQHKTDMPIGELTLEDRPEGLWCKGQLLMALPEAQKAYLLIKSRIVKGLSIGYTAIRAPVENGVRRLKEIRVFEGSIVTFPMSSTAMIHGVKQQRIHDESRCSALVDEIRATVRKGTADTARHTAAMRQMFGRK